MSRYASLAAHLLRRLHGDVAELPRPVDTGRLVAVARLALARRRRRLTSRRIALATVAVAAAAAVVLAAGPWLRRAPRALVAAAPSHPFSILPADGPAAVDEGPGAPLAAGGALGGTALATGVRLQAPAGAPVRIGSDDGTVLTLEPRGELAVVEQTATRRFALQRGAVRAHVAHLHAGERFIIATADAEVEVHGTVFRVALGDADPTCEDGRRTRVSVTQGVVSVRAGGHETLVPAGATWPACARREAPTEATSRPIAVSAPVVRREPARRRAHEVVPPPPARETAGLAMANDLFAAAVRAERAQRLDEAVRLFSRLLDVSPTGPLAEGAAARRMKLLAVTDAAAARRAAGDYLVRYPDGFARDDARLLAGNAP